MVPCGKRRCPSRRWKPLPPEPAALAHPTSSPRLQILALGSFNLNEYP